MNEQIIKYFQGELNTTERLRFLRQVEADGELKKQFIEYKNMHALLHLSDQADNKEENRQGYILFNKIIRTKKMRKIMLYASSYAAAITLLVLSTYWLTTSHYDTQQPVANIENILYVPAGQRVQLTLQDGTEVWLNSQTKLTYPALFTGKERRVTVEGEAFFDVAKNPDKPFIVSSQGVEMKVLGTKFNVYSYPGKESIQTSLLEGGLKVYFPHTESKGVILKPEEQVTIDFAYATVVTIRPVKKGECFTRENIWVKRPGMDGILAESYDSLLGKKALVDIESDVQLLYDMIEK